MNDKSTTVTIGIPVYNEIRFIERTLRSALGQAEEILISDNASTDGTSEFCSKFSEMYPNIKYIRHSENQGAVFNFNYVLNNASSSYFMWLGGHDLLPLNHVKKLKEILDSTDAVLAYSNAVHLTDEYVFKNVYQYNYSAHLCSENPAERVLSIISDLSDCTLYHGCYRIEVIKSALTHAYHEKYNGIDHGILGEVALLGKMILCKDTTYYRIEPREDKYDILHNWNRVIVSIYSNIYNKNIHIPELIPIGICYIQLRTAQKAAKFSKESDLYIDRIKHILWTRWADNEFIKDYIQKNFHIAKMHKSIPVRILRELSRNLRKLYKIIRT